MIDSILLSRFINHIFPYLVCTSLILKNCYSIRVLRAFVKGSSRFLLRFVWFKIWFVNLFCLSGWIFFACDSVSSCINLLFMLSGTFSLTFWRRYRWNLLNRPINFFLLFNMRLRKLLWLFLFLIRLDFLLFLILLNAVLNQPSFIVLHMCVVKKRLIIASCKGWNIYIDAL